MAEKRVNVWVQRFTDRKHLMLQWLDPETGKRRSVSAETADEAVAERKRADKEYELNHGLHKDPSRMNWEKFRETFEAEHAAACRPTTQDNFRAALDSFEHLCNPTNLRGINERMLSRFVAEMRKQPGQNGASLAPSTVRMRLRFLHIALAWAVEQKLVPACPKFPTVKVPKKKPAAVPSESFEKLLEKAPDAENRVFLLVGWLAGLRISEAMALEWEPTDEAPYLDFGRRRIWLPANFVKAAEDQWVPLDPELRAELESLPRIGRQVFQLRSARTGERMTRNGMSTRFCRLARRAGVKLSMHATRRGFLCRYAERVPAQVLQRLARHADIKITMDYYANVDAAVEEAVLGAHCNRSRNSNAKTPPTPSRDDAVTPDVEAGNIESSS